MSKQFLKRVSKDDAGFDPFDKAFKRQLIKQLRIEITPRCNLNCRHCYINRPAGDRAAKSEEWSLDEWTGVVRQAAELGALDLTITGGEPVLHPDFREIYLMAKRLGFVITLYSNATMISEENLSLLKEYPPRLIEVTVYGVSETVYERISRVKGSYRRFREGLDRLIEAGLPVVLKAMLLRSNRHEFGAILDFCREHNAEEARFDAYLATRADFNQARSGMIQDERILPDEMIELAESNPTVRSILEQTYAPGSQETIHIAPDRLFSCGIDAGGITVTHDGVMQGCVFLNHPNYRFDLREVSLQTAVGKLHERVRSSRVTVVGDQYKCPTCRLRAVCYTCPAKQYLEHQDLECHIDSLCSLTHRLAIYFNRNS